MERTDASADVSYDMFAIAAPGLEALVDAELRRLGARTTVVDGGVEFSGSARLLYRANLELRTASRVVVRIASFRARSFFELERHAKAIPWRRFVNANGGVTLRVTSSKSKLYHEGAVAQRLMSALSSSVKGVRDASAKAAQASSEGEEGEQDNESNAQMFIVRILRDECVVSADASGALLHRRGYRQAVAKAPLRETLAAAMLLSTGWNAKTPLIDPMCGAGTIAIEAALIARRIPPGLAMQTRAPRHYAFEQWPEFDAKMWADIVNRARGEILRTSPVRIAGSDRDAGAIASATANAQRAGVQGDVTFTQSAVSAALIPSRDAWLVSNPPYGVRVGGGDARNLYASVGRLVREQLPAGRLVLISPDRSLSAAADLPLIPVVATRNGGIVVQIMASPQRDVVAVADPAYLAGDQFQEL